MIRTRLTVVGSALSVIDVSHWKNMSHTEGVPVESVRLSVSFVPLANVMAIRDPGRHAGTRNTVGPPVAIAPSFLFILLIRAA
jgi:hypothetical protein